MRLHHLARTLAAALLLALPLEGISAHEGHDHDEAPANVVLPGAPRAEAASEKFELVAVARGAEIVIFLDRFATNEPVTDAAVAAETPQGSIEAVPLADGTYRLAAPTLAAAGRHDLIFTVTSDGAAEVLALTLDVPATSPAAEGRSPAALPAGSAMARDVKQRLIASDSGMTAALLIAFVAGALGGILLARRKKASGLLLGAAIGLASFASSSLAHEGEDHGTPPAVRLPAAREAAQLLGDGSVFVPKATQRILAIRTTIAEAAAYPRTVELPGRIIPDPNASGFVQAAVGGRLSPPAGGFPRLGTQVKKGDVLAYVTPPLQAIDVSDMRQRQGELDQQISIVERRVARYESLAATGAVARTQLDESRLELQGLKDRRSALDKARREPEPLVAPVDGIIADGNPVAGQIAQTNAMVFHIIDPARLWVEALSYEALPRLQRATARAGGRELSLAFRGAGFADRNQSIPIHFAIEGDVGSTRVGQFVTVLAETPDRQRGIAVPRSSIVRGSAGQDLVFEHVGAERFVPRPVRLEPLDGERVLVSQGLAPGRRIVVQGAELLDHVR